MYKDATLSEIESALNQSWKAFHIYRKMSLKQRADFMRAIGREIDNLGDELLYVTQGETNLPEARLRNERTRTIFQLNNYADACERGDWLEARIDTAIPDKNPPKPDLRKMLTALGPVVVFGAANFPYAYSTAGGDTACAFAAGCPVIVKAHPEHPRTSTLIASAILKAAANSYMPAGIFTHLYGASFEVGRTLVTQPFVKAVGFTGSFVGGKQLFDWANQRKEPIPVFAEMSSINPVFLLPEKMKQSAAEVAKMFAASITVGVGQFCTNPGLIIGIDNDDLKFFKNVLSEEIKKTNPGDMLNPGIFKNYVEKRSAVLSQPDVETIAVSGKDPVVNQGVPTIASASAQAFFKNHILHREVFGPFSLIIRCKDTGEMTEVAKQIEGQLTATLMATDEDVKKNPDLIESVKNICGRLIINGVPTGVEVCLSQQHGGPFPATTDLRFTAVGADGIKRFARPICFQNWSNELLPDELKNENPLKIRRTVNNEITVANI
ncbi:MAG: aldehyde dehydrogenase (NADP(+)) [Bacteroidetes bacterium]|nr:aldehyde dehydrogenase (NADP(+)) [Bacteroidota bacterium]MBS1930525.1 aldehyde dehydrogenase (NADP(+)) [Bacteroidota bacterium]